MPAMSKQRCINPRSPQKRFSNIFFGICIFFANSVIITIQLLKILFLFNLLIMVYIAPITSKQRPNYSKQKRIKFKLLGIMTVIIHFLLYFITDINLYSTNAIWVLTFQSIQLLFAKASCIL